MNPVHFACFGNDYLSRYDFLQRLFIDPILGLALDIFILVSTGHSSYIFARLTRAAMHSHISDLDNKVIRDDIPLVVFFTSFWKSPGSHTLLQLQVTHRIWR